MGTDGLVTARVAARFLGVGVWRFHELVRQGRIRPAGLGKRKKTLYRLEEVQELRKLRQHGQDFGYGKMLSMSLQAQALSSSTASRLDELIEFLGLRNERLSFEEADVCMFYEQAKARAETVCTDISATELLAWAKKLHAIDEPYLRTTALFLETKEPWRPFYELAENLLVSTLHKEQPTRARAYSFLVSARNNLRFVIYMYMKTASGRGIDEDVENLVLGQRDVDAEVLSHILSPATLE